MKICHLLAMKLTLLILITLTIVGVFDLFASTYVTLNLLSKQMSQQLTVGTAQWVGIGYLPWGKMSVAIRLVVEQLSLALGVLLLLAAASLFWLFYRYLTRPLREFADIIDHTDPQSPRASHLPEDRHDEMSQLARAYNRLVDKLYAHRHEIESQVMARMKALEQARQELEQVNQHNNRHLTSISHELRTPLSGALGAVELLQASEMDEKQSQLAETAQQCMFSLLCIINNLLDFSRIESGSIPLCETEEALLPQIDRVMQTIQGPCQAKGLSLSAFVDRDVPLLLTFDAMRVRQILINLLGNAVKFTQCGGITLTVTRQDNHLFFAVCDSGQGISSEDQQTIFAPFFQAQGHVEGTGLGLSISSHLARMMGGGLELESTQGLGTRVSFMLPLKAFREPIPLNMTLEAPAALHRQLSAWGITCQAAQTGGALDAEELTFLPGGLYDRVRQILSGVPDETGQSIPVQPWRLKILLVDDGSINRDIIGLLLESLGQDVTTVSSGAEALEQGRQYRFDLVLMDIQMPDMDGIEASRRWRSDAMNRDPACMIMALSADAEPEEMIFSKNVGIDHYLVKPVTLLQLAESVGTAAEYQLQRDQLLMEQDPALDIPLLDLNVVGLREKIYGVLWCLLREIENHLSDQKRVSALLHTLKGALGQVGLVTLLCRVTDMERRVHLGFHLQSEDVIALRRSLSTSLHAVDTAEPTLFSWEVLENDRS